MDEIKTNSSPASNPAQQKAKQRRSGRGWWNFLMRVKKEESEDNLTLISAGVAFYAFFALFPAIAALVSLYGLVASPEQIQKQIDLLSGTMPSQAFSIIQHQLNEIVRSSEKNLGWGLVFGILLTLWSSSKAMQGVIQALNITYDLDERRGFFKFYAVALILTLASLLFFIVALVLIVALPAALEKLVLSDSWRLGVSIIRWVVLGTTVAVGLNLLYRYAPNRNRPGWRWVTWGSVTATILWLAASMLFSWYVSNLEDYNETFGSLGAVAVLMMWFFISAYVVLLGSEINAEIEYQARLDSAKKQFEPMSGHDDTGESTHPQ